MKATPHPHIHIDANPSADPDLLINRLRLLLSGSGKQPGISRIQACEVTIEARLSHDESGAPRFSLSGYVPA